MLECIIGILYHYELSDYLVEYLLQGIFPLKEVMEIYRVWCCKQVSFDTCQTLYEVLDFEFLLQ
jgi:hypothetical protein